jgi:hypothetical protein
LQFAEPIRVLMNSRTSQGVIFKPAPKEQESEVASWRGPGV